MKIITTLFFLLLSGTTLQAQIQKGSDMDGEAADDYSGCSVSMFDANTVAIGAYGNDGTGNDAGHVRIYSFNGSAWIQKGSDIDGEATGDNSGFSVSMPDANTVAIGASENDGSGSAAGHVRIYSWNGTMWVQKGNDIDGEASGDRSGSSVSMPDANTVAIGAPWNDGTANGAGHVRIYSWNGNAWVQKGLDIDGEAASDNSGSSVSMPDANTIAIGAPWNNGTISAAGQVRIYSWDGGAWVQKGLDIDGEAADDRSGHSVSMPDSNTVAIGAPWNDGNGNNSGHVRIYSWSGSAWVLKGSDINGEFALDRSGSSVSMPDANTVAIGAPWNNGTGSNAGHVRIFSWNGSTWQQKGNDMDGEATGDFSGWSVSMPNVNTVAIGAYLNDGTGSNSGHVRVYSFCTTSTASTISPIACNSYTSPSGNYTWSNSGSYLDTIPNSAGCDSVITINLTIHSVNDSVTNTSPTLTASATGATYQWVDCNNTYNAINGATGQSFTAIVNGSYAVIVTQNGCTDTSDCETVSNVGIIESGIGNSFTLFPNPTDGAITINLGQTIDNLTVTVKNALGQEVYSRTYNSVTKFELQLDVTAGMYVVTLTSQQKSLAHVKIIKT
ncbi:MAG: T9SS type A sorting domain-containing protein [Bacteroidia bacterium]|nr:T9SS type A sorting domain-containing protein [Bacteroidia bacterium]MCZ2278383.1 T9SS type A sorting domain-containing protein [Bacteroidia bacterium]